MNTQKRLLLAISLAVITAFSAHAGPGIQYWQQRREAPKKQEKKTEKKSEDTANDTAATAAKSEDTSEKKDSDAKNSPAGAPVRSHAAKAH